MARKLAASHGLGANDVIVDRDKFEELIGLLYCLSSALDDIEKDLASSDEPTDIAEALSWLRENAEPLAKVSIEPKMSHEA